jgi:cbb3-type cytochrome oxidase subunit 3
MKKKPGFGSFLFQAARRAAFTIWVILLTLALISWILRGALRRHF